MSRNSFHSPALLYSQTCDSLIMITQIRCQRFNCYLAIAPHDISDNGDVSNATDPLDAFRRSIRYKEMQGRLEAILT